MSLRIIGISGSLRKYSYTTQLLRVLQLNAPQGVDFEIVPIGELPLINQDLEADLPKPVRDLHNKIEKADAVIFATPEYNRSYTPVIKNAIDWGSRPQGQNKWDKKPAAVLGCSPYTLGAFGAVNHLRQVLLYVNTYPMQQPEFYLSEIAKKIDENDNITDALTKEMVGKFWAAFVSWTNNFNK